MRRHRSAPRPRRTFLRHSRLVLLLAVAALFTVLLVGLWPRLTGQRPSGLKVLGHPLPSAESLEPHLHGLRDSWRSRRVVLRVAQDGFSTTRAALGADLPLDAIEKRIRAYGRSDKPLVSMMQTYSALLGGATLPWTPTLEANQLQASLDKVRRHVERPPVVGTRDDDGQVIDGHDGKTINLIEEVSNVSRGLLAGQTEFRLTLVTVPAPEPLDIGAADGAVYSEHVPPPPPGEQVELPPALRSAQLAAQPSAWLPDQGRECIESGQYRGFCEGPRRTPEPFGADAERAAALGLGGPQAVAAALNGRIPETWLRTVPETLDHSLLPPVPAGRLWRGFGMVPHTNGRQRLHKGLDLGAPEGTPIRASQSGLVVYGDNAVRGYGNLLVLVHDDGSATFYAHCRALYVFPGQTVQRGAIIAEVGDTGFARGKHLHFEYHHAGVPTDPQPLLERP